ncbi:hypothetical protein [Halorubrum trueperi]|uniref:Uncharacterized protein n=1 Tax=Halorubrum trueperi TaxID=2004704 RepID=A0ABD5UGR1_9EURY
MSVVFAVETEIFELVFGVVVEFGAFGFYRFVVDLDLIFTGFDDPVLTVL